MDMEWLDSTYKQLIKEATGKNVELERRLEIRSQLAEIRRKKKKLKQSFLNQAADSFKYHSMNNAY